MNQSFQEPAVGRVSKNPRREDFAVELTGAPEDPVAKPVANRSEDGPIAGQEPVDDRIGIQDIRSERAKHRKHG